MAIEGSIQTILSALTSGRAYPMVAPDPVVAPYTIYQVISDVMENDLDGFTGQSNKRVQVDVYHTSYGAVKTLAESVKTNMAAGAVKNRHLSSRDLYEDEVQLYRISMDFSVWN